MLKGMPNLGEDYSIRPAGVGDAGVIARHRAAMFFDMGSISAEDAELLRQASEPWVAGLLANGGYLGWLVEHERIVVAGGGIVLRELMPVPGCYRVGRWGHIVNVYTDPDRRRLGLARSVMQSILNWCAQNALDHLTLAASEEGRPLYQALGFVPTNDMRLTRSAVASQ